MDTIIKIWNINKEDKKLQLHTLYCKKEGKAKNNQIIKLVASQSLFQGQKD